MTKSNRPTPVGRYPSEVVAGFLYLGDWEHATAEDALQDLSITHILTAHSSALSLKARFSQLHLEIEDEPKEDIARFFGVSGEYVEKARADGGRVLVHCGAGASRSATLCAAFLMHSQQWTANHALKHLKHCRSKVAPNEGFLKALEEYERLESVSSEHDGARRASGKRGHVGASGDDDVDGKHPVMMYTGLTLDVIKDGVRVGTIDVERGQEHVLGRSPSCHTVLNHSSISKTHACIRWSPSQDLALITDLGSLHGTRVDGRRVVKDTLTVLSEGSIVTFAASTRSYVARYTHSWIMGHERERGL